MLSWQSILRIGCQTERLAQLRAFAIIGVILLQRRSRITMPPCEYFTLFYIQCGVYTEFGIEPLIISDAHSGLVSAIRESFPGASWQRCKVHFMRNILAYVPQKEQKSFAETLKEIWLAPTAEFARKRAYDVIDSYAKCFPKAVLRD